MSDLIDKQVAIDAIHCDITVTGRQNAELVAATIGAFVDRIKALPSAQPERIRGRWIPWDGDDCYECSACRGLWTFPDGTPEENGANFCPMCGADMRDQEGEE